VIDTTDISGASVSRRLKARLPRSAASFDSRADHDR